MPKLPPEHVSKKPIASTTELTSEQAKRYSRHILLPNMDWEGQERLVNSTALVLGVGGLGCAAAQYLAASGIGHIILVDDDVVELSNLQRQVLHSESRLGQNKAVSAKRAIEQLNSTLQVTAIERRLTRDELIQLAQDAHVLLDCTDNLQSRNRLNEVSVATQTALITGAAIRFEGQVACFIPNANDAEKSPCYACLSYLFGEQNLSCMEAGVVSPLVGIVGAMQALEAVKYISLMGNVRSGKLLMFDALTSEWRTLNVQRNTHCHICSCNSA